MATMMSSGQKAVKGRGKKGGGGQKKLPGRGMGVAQLERIRMQECWKLFSTTADPNPPPPPPQLDPSAFALHLYAGGSAGVSHSHAASLPPGLHRPTPTPTPLPPFHQLQQNRVRLMGPGELPSIPNPLSCHPHYLDFNTFTPKGAEVVAVHRKGARGRADRKLVMEYGFFPPTSSSAAPSSSSSSAPGYVTSYYPSSTHIDLSLRL